MPSLKKTIDEFYAYINGSGVLSSELAPAYAVLTNAQSKLLGFNDGATYAESFCSVLTYMKELHYVGLADEVNYEMSLKHIMLSFRWPNIQFRFAFYRTVTALHS